MRKARYLLSFALLMAASLYLLPALQAADDSVPDSPEVTELLTQAKTHALAVRGGTDRMASFRLNKLSWQSQGAEAYVIRTHVNQMGELLKQMGERYEWASPWQQTAMDRINPLVAQMASGIGKTIDYINENQNDLYLRPYSEMLTSNFEIASALFTTVDEFVTYGKSRSKGGKLGIELEIPGR